MSQKWNLQDIRPSGSAKERFRAQPAKRPQQDIATRRPPISHAPYVPDPEVATIDIVDGKSAKRKRVIVSSIIALFIIGGGIAMNVFMGGAEVTVYPRFKDVNVQANFTAYREPKAGELGYELLTLEAEGERQVKATGQEMVSERATGNILIYNTQESGTQRLIKNTRFETTDGLIFRIKESVEVPAASKDAKGNIAPGVVTAEVFADGTGDQYNIAPAKFTVPGLKGSDQFEKVYAESNVGFSGGFEGNKYIIDEGELDTTKQALHLELRDSLLAKLEAERPAGFILYKDAVTFAFDSLPATSYGSDLATIKERARMQVPMFKESEFSQYLAAATIPGYENEPISLTDPMQLTFSYPSATTTTSDISTETDLDFKLQGGAQLVWQYDAEKLKQDLAGLPETGARSVMTAYPALTTLKVVIRPFWASSFPDNSQKIKINAIIGEKEPEKE